MKTVAHSVCETINIVPARFFIKRRIDETIACPKDDTVVSAPAIADLRSSGVLAVRVGLQRSARAHWESASSAPG